jgi:hypothetical protein
MYVNRLPADKQLPPRVDFIGSDETQSGTLPVTEVSRLLQGKVTSSFGPAIGSPKGASKQKATLPCLRNSRYDSSIASLGAAFAKLIVRSTLARRNAASGDSAGRRDDATTVWLFAVRA